MKKIQIIGIIVLLYFLAGCALGNLNPYQAIDFFSNHGTPVDVIIALPGANITEPTPPTREHYVFGGWYADIDLTTPYVFDKMPMGGTTLFAKWNGTIVETLEGLRLLLKEDGTYGVEGYVGTNPVVNVPSSYNQIPVTSIELYAFHSNTFVTNITLPNTITLIREGAFHWTRALTELEIPASVTKIESSLFSGSYELRKVTFAPNSQITEIPAYAFIDSYITSIIIPASVISIGEYAFLESSIFIIRFESEDNLISIGDYAFAQCKNLMYVLLPASVISIGEGAFGRSTHDKANYPLNIYVRPTSTLSGWNSNWYEGDEVFIEWGSTKKWVTITISTIDDVVLFFSYHVSGTPLFQVEPPMIGLGRIDGLYLDKQLTQPHTLTIVPENSITMYAKIVYD